MASKDKTFPLDFPALAAGREAREVAGNNGRVYGYDKRLLRNLLRVTGYPPVGFVLWNGEEVVSPGAKPVAHLHIRDRQALYGLVRNPSVNFGDLYSSGQLEVEGDLSRFLETTFRGVTQADEASFFRRWLSRVLKRSRPNTLNDSRNNIHRHYDIGNDFYTLWLDQRMQYTCAYYPEPSMSLEEAQLAKLDHVCRKLRLKPGETVVEAGCGWGGLARHMVRHYGVKVQSFNISHEQIRYARERAKAGGLEGQVEYVEDDYRNISGRYDVFVSVGMLEHVGKEHYQELGAVIHRCLKDNGRGLIHTIGRNKARLMNGWTEKRIFPGAYPPTLREMMDIFEPWEFSVLDVENLRLHYAKTLEHWLERYEGHADRVREMFDEQFVRTWRLYLAGSIAAFTTGSLQLFQIVFAQPTDNQLPWSRAYLYQSEKLGADPEGAPATRRPPTSPT